LARTITRYAAYAISPGIGLYRITDKKGVSETKCTIARNLVVVIQDVQIVLLNLDLDTVMQEVTALDFDSAGRLK